VSSEPGEIAGIVTRKYCVAMIAARPRLDVLFCRDPYVGGAGWSDLADGAALGRSRQQQPQRSTAHPAGRHRTALQLSCPGTGSSAAARQEEQRHDLETQRQPLRPPDGRQQLGCLDAPVLADRGSPKVPNVDMQTRRVLTTTAEIRRPAATMRAAGTTASPDPNCVSSPARVISKP
jgi:hypothetical protein